MPTSATEPPYTKGEAGLSGHPANHFFVGQATGAVALNGGPALTTTYQQLPFLDNRTGGAFLSAVVSLSNDDPANYIEYSFDGKIFDGRLYAGETFTMPIKAARSIWLRGQAGGELYRVTAY